MKFSKFLYCVSLALLLSGCNVDWIWTPVPGPGHDLTGTFLIVDSTGYHSLPGDWSGITVRLMEYNGTVLDSAVTLADGSWRMLNAPLSGC